MKSEKSNDVGDAKEATKIFERVTGISSVPTETVLIGNRSFLNFIIGREAPLYEYALLETQKALPDTNSFVGALALKAEPAKTFPSSLESRALLTLLTRSTKEVSEGAASAAYRVPYIPFQGREDHQLAQPANHIVRGRRGVGKSTLIGRAQNLLRNTGALVIVIDMQTYSSLTGDDLIAEIFRDVSTSLGEAANAVAGPSAGDGLMSLADQIGAKSLSIGQLPVNLKRALAKVTKDRQAFVFLDDFHLLDRADQPEVLEMLTGALKGANGWLKVAGLTSRLNPYDPTKKRGLQVPGDAQYIQLDLTLTDPESTEVHLEEILRGFVAAVGYQLGNAVIPDIALRRLAWANAGVPRDFLQMFARSLEHAQRNRRSAVTLSDVNVAIGEFGQQKMDELQKDARNDAGDLRGALEKIEEFCLGEKQVNAFLVRSEDSKERDTVRDLADLRMVHLIHQSITPSRSGERYEAYILDYSIFTGFRRRKGIREMLPDESQFKASELRALPRINPGFLDHVANEVSQTDISS
jgi:Cdc6-like AAA superfamily ATPase